jgi:hypothetical protein
MRSRIYSFPLNITSRDSFTSVRFLADMMAQSIANDQPIGSAVLVCVNLPIDQADQLGKIVQAFVQTRTRLAA